MATEQHVRAAARLYEARDAVRSLFGERYADVLEPFKAMIRKAQALNDCDEIAAALWIARRVSRSDGMEVLKILAAAVELVEPSSVPTSEKQP
jgi:hypothetical protein